MNSNIRSSFSGSFRWLALAALVALSLPGGTAHAQSRSSRFGLGGMVGEPTGLSMKLRLADAFAIDFGVGFGALGPGAGSVHADFLGSVNLTNHSRAGMDLYFGAGPKLAFANYNNSRWGAHDGLWVAVRGDVGLVWEFNQRHLDVFIEAGPEIWLIQDVFFNGFAAAGARYWF